MIQKPSNNHQFGNTKIFLHRKNFASSSNILLKLAANGPQHIFEKWVERCKKCIAFQGKYFEKETLTAPPQSSDSE
jgi:hypothetical protein